MSADKLSRKEVDYVLRRAAEIDSSGGGAGHAALVLDADRTNEPALSTGEVLRLGAEAGLRPDALVTAMAEVQRGAAVMEPETGVLSRVLGPGRFVVSRVVPGPPEPVQRAVDRFLREQLMTVRRHHGQRVEWERAQGLWPGLVRSLDVSRRYGFGLVNRVETIVMSEGEDTAVTFNLDVSEMRRDRFSQMSLRAALAFLLVGVGGTALFPGFSWADALALAGGGVTAGGLFAVDRRRYFQSRERAEIAPERFLDFLVQRRRR